MNTAWHLGQVLQESSRVQEGHLGRLLTTQGRRTSVQKAWAWDVCVKAEFLLIPAFFLKSDSKPWGGGAGDSSCRYVVGVGARGWRQSPPAT